MLLAKQFDLETQLMKRRISKAVQGRICQGEFRGEFEKRGSGGFGKESLGEDLPGRVLRENQQTKFREDLEGRVEGRTCKGRFKAEFVESGLGRICKGGFRGGPAREGLGENLQKGV